MSREGDVVAFSQTPQIGAWVRRQGSDVAAGSVILHVGDRLTPGVIGMAASIGRAYVTVFRKLRVGVFFSGDELVQPANRFIRAASTTPTVSWCEASCSFWAAR